VSAMSTQALGWRRHHPELLDLVGLETVRQQFGKVRRSRRWEDGIDGGIAAGAMVRVVRVVVTDEAVGGIEAHHHFRA